MINNLTPYRLPTKYEKLKQQAFNLVKEKIINDINEDVHLQYLGVDVDQLDVEKYTYLIEYLLYARIQADTFVESQGGCITQADVNEIKDDYLIDCILEQGVCEGYTRDLVDFMFKFPLCTDDIIYEWINPSTSCKSIDSFNYQTSTTVIQKRSDVILQVASIPVDYSFAQFQAVFPDATQADFDARLIEDTNNVCCLEDEPTNTIISLVNAGNNTLDFEWTNVADSYQITLRQGETVITNITTGSTSYQAAELIVDTEYTFEIISTNCAGSSTSTITASTLPYTVSVELCADISDSIRVTNTIGTQNPDGKTFYYITVTDFGNPLNINFEPSGNVPPYAELTSVLVNESEDVNNVQYTEFIRGYGVGGNIVIPSVDRNYNIVVCGDIINMCDILQVSYDGGSSTLTIN